MVKKRGGERERSYIYPIALRTRNDIIALPRIPCLQSPLIIPLHFERSQKHIHPHVSRFRLLSPQQHFPCYPSRRASERDNPCVCSCRFSKPTTAEHLSPLLTFQESTQDRAILLGSCHFGPLYKVCHKEERTEKRGVYIPLVPRMPIDTMICAFTQDVSASKQGQLIALIDFPNLRQHSPSTFEMLLSRRKRSTVM